MANITAINNFLSVYVRFLVLPIEYYTVQWLQRAGNLIRHTLRVYDITLLAYRGKFARVSVEVVLNKPLKAGYILRGKQLKIQCEGLHIMCFHCGKYGHNETTCPMKKKVKAS